MSHPAIPAQRQKQILEYIKDTGSGQIRELAAYTGVSEATIRRDLDALDRAGLIERKHGGAVTQGLSTSFEQIHSEKMKLMLDEKRRIARRAAHRIKDGESVFLDSGTTSFFVGANLKHHRNLTIVTHNLQIAANIEIDRTSSVIVTGGIRRDEYSVLAGAIAEDFVRDLSVDRVILGADAVDAALGVYNSNFVEIGMKKLLVRCGRQTILTCDSSKFTGTALAKICDIGEIDTIITDTGLDEEKRRELLSSGVELILV
ncbi:DeoR/GlpR family DNA-binding transcription regulator [Feifania hominis]|uniref:DeoR/GlpR transcriptional regulator n=1 Tax=Feifania hominis TaxID=2763660 RepID=A0A926HV62_9FIRM|nr:DeoR/GlpR family DNA-binding transcription regulator [Feifania hominis]MBC8536660.1 DeoR/GlpR transcriptional regulator [Feifania hominis]